MLAGMNFSRTINNRRVLYTTRETCITDVLSLHLNAPQLLVQSRGSLELCCGRRARDNAHERMGALAVDICVAITNCIVIVSHVIPVNL